MLTTRKPQELDVVELTEDLPEFGLKKGEIGAVVVAFDHPDEAYDLEFVDESGKSRFAYAVKPNQVAPVNEVAEDIFRGPN
jgi:metal-dependent hydrolase (beta-lactamase superfamily II)